ncbi:MAG: InlB B-repeat-containing protein [Oscillospiraceae bacterium]|nr:InlB B-repeat-containing protein [Oscillospiraceae bacterium]
MKRTLSMLLACLMLIGMLPVSALATEAEILPVEEIAFTEEAATETVPETEAVIETEPAPETEATEAAQPAPETEAAEVTETEAIETEAAEEEILPEQTEAVVPVSGVAAMMQKLQQNSQLPEPGEPLNPEMLENSGDVSALDVGDRVFREVEPNDTLSSADAIANDYTVNATLSGRDTDFFAFTVSAGTRVSFVAVAARRDMAMGIFNRNEEAIAADTEGEYTSSGNYAYAISGTINTAGTYYLCFVQDSSYNNAYTFYAEIGSGGGSTPSSSYTISYNGNGGSGAPSSQTTNSSGSVTLSSTVPTRTGYTFLGWATSSTASSASYYPGRSYTFSRNTTLYAVWQAATAIPADVTNSNFSASISFGGGYKMYSFRPTSSRQLTIESSGSQDTKIFVYNSSGTEITSNDDGGTNSNFKLQYTFSANTTYYIKVMYYGASTTGTINFNVKGPVPTTYTITYNANGGTGAPSSQTTTGTLTLSSTLPSRTGYTFLGWATSSSATTATHLPGRSYSFTGSTTLYAVWQAATVIPADVTNSNFSAVISFGGGYKMYSYRPTSSRQLTIESSGSADTKIYVYNSSGSQVASDDDSSSNGTNFKLQYTFSANTTYYIKVMYYGTDTTGTINFNVKGPVPTTYTITYNANGGTGAPSSQTTTGALTLNNTVLNRTGYTFLGWATSSSATTATHLPGRSYTFTANTTLYAVWQAATVIPADVTNSNFTATVAFTGGYQMFSYRPTTTRQLTFESSVSQDVAVEILNSSGTQLATDDDGGVETNFKLTYTFNANTQYYIKVRYFNGSTVTGSIAFNVKTAVTTYTVTYHPNDGTNIVRTDEVTNPFTVVEQIPEKDGYVFQGWSSSASATTVTHVPGRSYPITADMDLYAVWQAEAPTNAKIKVSTPTGMAGQQVAVTISLENNPGLASMQLSVGYDSDVLTLVSVTDGGHLGTAVHSDNVAANPYTLTWANDLATENFTYNGSIVTLNFLVAEDAEEGRTPITVSYDYNNYDIFDVDGEKVRFNTENGYVDVTDVVVGDVNGDGNVNTQDRMILTRYLARWTGYGEDSINAAAADVNADGRVNTQDRMILTRYLARWSGYDELPYTE